MQKEYLTIKGAKVHNLQNIDVKLPRNKLIVFTGLSGSGKSSLAFDTIYAEGQRRYVESLSSYARMFLGVVDKPDVESIDGLSPAIAIDQKSVSHNPRSTVGTVTEIYDYLRLLYARVGHPHCPKCGLPIKKQSVQSITDQILKYSKTLKEIIILAPIIEGKKGQHVETFKRIKSNGYRRVRVDGETYSIRKALTLNLERYKKHYIEIILNRIDTQQSFGQQLFSQVFESIEQSLKIGNGKIKVQEKTINNKIKEVLFSEKFSCEKCEISFPDIEPRSFSFNNPFGACETCKGLGYKKEIDPELVAPNKNLSLAEGALFPLNKTPGGNWFWKIIEKVAISHNISLRRPISNLRQEELNLIFYGTGKEKYLIKNTSASGRKYEMEIEFEGLINNLQRRYEETSSDYIRTEIEKFMRLRPCPTCQGRKLKEIFLNVTVAGKPIHQIVNLPINKALQWFINILNTKNLKDKDPLNLKNIFKHIKNDNISKNLHIEKEEKILSSTEKKIAKQILNEIIKRLEFLSDVGLNYLTLDRTAKTLSGGEAQRIRLATQIGAGLSGVLYVLDEPSIGLHQRDNDQLIKTLKKLRDLGNTVIVVEHDEDTIRTADYVLDIGPKAGQNGGKIVFEGSPKELEDSESITGKYLSKKKSIIIPKKHRPGNNNFLRIIKASENNLKEIDVSFPLGKMILVTGVSGSGKSSLVNDTLAKLLEQKINRARVIPGKHEKFKGYETVGKVVNINQSPIGRTPRSNPATYTGLFTPIRELFAEMPEAKMKGYKPGRFSFNVKGGRCEACNGEGVNKIEMHFLPDVYVECPECKGKRYNSEALEITYRGKNIADVLDMTVSEAIPFFNSIPNVLKILKTLDEVGLSYIKLGQSATTLSGGEAQRIKLASELSKNSLKHTVYILDEPTTGLHFEDVKKLLEVLNKLADRNNTVIIIEHNLDVIKQADWIIDLGPEGGEAGGQIIAEGTPEEIARKKNSYTGKYLKRYFS